MKGNLLTSMIHCYSVLVGLNVSNYMFRVFCSWKWLTIVNTQQLLKLVKACGLLRKIPMFHGLQRGNSTETWGNDSKDSQILEGDSPCYVCQLCWNHQWCFLLIFRWVPWVSYPCNIGASWHQDISGYITSQIWLEKSKRRLPVGPTIKMMQ